MQFVNGTILARAEEINPDQLYESSSLSKRIEL